MTSTSTRRVANVVAAAIQRPATKADLAAIRDELEIQLADMTRLHTLNERLSGGLELPEVLEQVLEAVTGLQGPTGELVTLYDPDRRTMPTAASIGFEPDQLADGETAPARSRSEGDAGRLQRRHPGCGRRGYRGRTGGRHPRADRALGRHCRAVCITPLDPRWRLRRNHRDLLPRVLSALGPRDQPGRVVRPPGGGLDRECRLYRAAPRGGPTQG